MTTQDLLDLKQEIDESKESISKAEGRKEALQEQLQKQFGVKTIAAAEKKLKLINSNVNIEAHVADVNYKNIEQFIKGADIVIDGLDNFETRYLLCG